MASKKQLTKRMRALGMAWAVRWSKFVDPSDPMGDQVRGHKTYHVHPDASQPWQNAIKRFDTLRELEEYVSWREKVAAARAKGDEEYAEALMDDEPGRF